MRSLLRARILRVGAALAGAAAIGCAEPVEPPRPNILLIVLDTFRADRMGAHGNPRGLTPFLDGLAARGVLFERAYSTSAWTPPSVASLLTSRHPVQHRVRDFNSKLGAAETTLVERVQRLGYRTGGFSANLYVRENAGFGQGFDALRLFVTLRRETKERLERLHDPVLRWIDEAPAEGERRPQLLYLHLMDVHSPYEPPEPFRARFAPHLDEAEIEALNDLVYDARKPEGRDRLRERRADLAALYDAEVAGLDAALARLFESLEARRFLDDAVVVVLSDHGEEFGEHGEFLHGWQLYEESVRVPLLIVAPGLAGGRRVRTPVSLVDVAPTILALLGEPLPEAFEGRSLLPLLDDPARKPERADVFLDLAREDAFVSGGTHAAGVVRGSRKLLVDPDGDGAVFDLAEDPDERSPRDGTDELRRALEQARARWTETAATTAERVFVDEATRARLRALGYQTEAKDEAR